MLRVWWKLFVRSGQALATLEGQALRWARDVKEGRGGVSAGVSGVGEWVQLNVSEVVGEKAMAHGAGIQLTG